MYSFCDIPTYELLTGTTVPDAEEEHVQAMLDLNSDLAGLYMGEPCATNVQTGYPELLAGIVCYRTYRQQTIPAGVQSESVGSSSVSYVPSQNAPMGMTGTETAVLDQLCGRITHGRGIGSVSFAEKAYVTIQTPAQVAVSVAAQLGFPTTWPGWAETNRSTFVEPEVE